MGEEFRRVLYRYTKGKAMEDAHERIEEEKKEAARTAIAAAAISLRDYIEPFYLWDRCPHIARLIAEKKQISKRHAINQRILIDKFILKDSIADKNLHELRRGDVLDFRQRLLTSQSDRQTNRIIGVLKTCIKEGVYREEIDRDPTLGIGNIHHEAAERGIFTVDEIRRIFPKADPGPWADLQAYTCFLLAATIGLRRGEVLALRWKDVDFEKHEINVQTRTY